MKLDPCTIGLVVVFREFIKVQKLGPQSNFCLITFEEFNKFWSKQSSSKRRSSENSIAASSSPQSGEINHSSSKLSSNLEHPSASKKSRSTIKVEFKYFISKIIDSKEVLTIFKGFYLTSINDVLSMPVSELKNVSACRVMWEA